MKMNQLGRTDIKVSEICLGTMTWGSQNTEAEGHEQMDYAADNGINFFDTAEMYPVTPIAKETFGRTEEIVGTWFEKSGRRDDIILATKVTGIGFPHIEDQEAITPDRFKRSIDNSLKRLKTDYIDLYQLHWPNRGSYHFRQSFTFDASKQDKAKAKDDIHAVLEAAKEAVKSGKIRQIGLSNESAWGTCQFVKLAEEYDLPRVVSIQNEYSLLQRIFDLDLAETAFHEDVGCLAWSPLAMGILSGKYIGGAVPKGSRKELNAILGGRTSQKTDEVTEKYVAIAKKHSLDPNQMAIAFCIGRYFMTSTIIGATNMEQLKTNIGSHKVTLSEEVMNDIQEVYRNDPIPM